MKSLKYTEISLTKLFFNNVGFPVEEALFM